VLKARDDLNAVLHTHTPSMMGVSTHSFGLLPISQHWLEMACQAQVVAALWELSDPP